MDWEKINHYVLEKQQLANKCDNILKCVEDIAGLNSMRWKNFLMNSYFY
jgi:hypothetical protein